MDIVDYVQGCTDSFAERPLCSVDSLVFSCLAYLWLPEVVPDVVTAEGVALSSLNDGATMLSLTAPLANYAKHERLLKAVVASPRFAGVRACLAREDSDPAVERQFATVTFGLPTGEAYVAFRGTDNTLLGWKEDFNMAFMPVIPAQEAARAHLEAVARELAGPLYVGGHSKGGNLATYAVVAADEHARGRVLRCFDHDGPGFLDETQTALGSSDGWALVEKTVPGESLVGLLLGTSGSEPIVVQSTKQGVLQHDPFSWVVSGTDFVRQKALSYDAYRTGKRLNAWLRTMDPAERERFVDILYRVVRAGGEVTFSGLVQSLGDGSLSLMLRRLDGLPEADRTFFLDKLGDLAATLVLGTAPVQATTPAERTSAAVDKVDDITARFNDTMAKWERYFE